MKISLVTPAGKQTRAGNRTTAVRWARLLRDMGHRVEISEESDGASADMMIAVHAWRSAKSIRAFSDKHPAKPLVVLLAGTDIYLFQHSHPADTIESMERATRLVCLHDLVHRAIPEKFAGKLRVIHQSSLPLPTPRRPSTRWFEVCVAGHLREEKDSLRTAYAARLVPADSKLRVIQLGRAHDDAWARDARAEMAQNPRFIWRGEVPGWQVRRQFARSHAMVISSIMEGGANIVSEAIVCGVPVIASHIDGNIGLLGADYAGYYPAKDEVALAALLQRAEDEPAFLKTLVRQCRAKKPLFTAVREKAAWQTLLKEMGA
jgi:putative glycosyltransferase (TIGR04348 family)